MLKAFEYMENNLKREISLYDISQAAGFSVPHFYRLFKRLTGDTVGAYLLRRRLALAARDLVETGRSVMNISMEYGFESHDVFTRAFARVYGMSPNKYRKSTPPPPLKKTVTVEKLPDAQEISDGRQMRFSTLESEGFSVIGMKCTARLWDEDNSIGRLWGAFLPRVDEIRDRLEPAVMYGICICNSFQSGTLPYLAGMAVRNTENIPAGMVPYELRSQKYFQAEVPAEVSVPDAYMATIGYARSLGFVPDEQDQIEVYEETFRDPADHCFKLWIPIK